MNRRQFLDRLSRAAAASALTRLFAPVASRAASAVPPGDYPFSLGVASGMPRPDSVVLWTRLAPRPHDPLGGLPDAPLAVRWELAEDEAFSRGLRQGTTTALAQHAHSVHVEVVGLASDARYFYRFIAGDAVSPTGRTRTAPAADAEVGSLRLALASCQHYEQGAFVALREIAERDLDFVLFVGDYIYENSNRRYRLRSHEGPTPKSLDAYRARYATYKLDADLRAAHAAHPWVLTWDDHEVEDDYAGEHGTSGQSPADFMRRRAAAYKAYFEHQPVSPGIAPDGPSMRLHDRYAWGRLADLWTLDNRQFRSVQACSDGSGGGVVGRCDELADPSRSIFGSAQERWLAKGLAGSARRWKLLAQGTQISPSGIDTPFGRRVMSDGWDGYPPARERLLHSIAEPKLSDVVCLGGDVHRHVAAQLRLRGNDPRSPIVASEFVCSSITTHGLSEALTGLINASNPDMLHGRSDERGYALLEITPEATRCDFRATPFPARATARLTSQARFVVEQGRAGVVPEHARPPDRPAA
jgi:alkaline phosphatase D